MSAISGRMKAFFRVVQGHHDSTVHYLFVLEARIAYEQHVDCRKKKQINTDSIFDLLVLAFFGRGELLVCHSKLCRLISGSYWKNPRFITCYDMFKKKFFVIFDAFKKIQASIHSAFFLFFGEVSWNHLSTNFLHAQILGQHVYSSVVQIQPTTDHSVTRRADITRALILATFSSFS